MKNKTAKVKIMSRLSVQQFSGYCFYGVELKTRSQRSWKGAVQHFGRTDTIEQAVGRAAEYVRHLPIECVRHDACYFSWKTARAIIGLPEEPRFKEGIIEWSGVSTERKQSYHDEGIAFLSKYREDVERRNSIRRTAVRNRPRKLPAHLLATLEIESTVTDSAAIKEAYQRAISIHHPDKGGNGAKFIAVRKAYKRLSMYLGVSQ